MNEDQTPSDQSLQDEVSDDGTVDPDNVDEQVTLNMRIVSKLKWYRSVAMRQIVLNLVGVALIWLSGVLIWWVDPVYAHDLGNLNPIGMTLICGMIILTSVIGARVRDLLILLEKIRWSIRENSELIDFAMSGYWTTKR